MIIKKQHRVMILKNPINKWDKNNRATINDPTLAVYDRNQGHVLMLTKLRKLLRDYDERIVIDNSLVLEILDAYAKKSRQLRAAEKEIAELKKQLKAR